MNGARIAVTVDSASRASDLGYQAVADLVEAAGETEYRLVGGHMVQMLIHAYPTALAIPRTTSDADAGIDRATAAGQGLHDQLLERGYTATAGNSYEKPAGDDKTLQVDLLVPHGTPGVTEQIGERGFDSAPGLSLALAAAPLVMEVKVRLLSGDTLEFVVLVPDVEAALVLKALVWRHRFAEKDLSDISSLLEITQEHRDRLTSWKLDGDVALKGTRKDAADALHMLAGMCDEARVAKDSSRSAPPRISALIKRHVARPS